MKNKFLVWISGTLLATACSTAQFGGETPSKASSSEPTPVATASSPSLSPAASTQPASDDTGTDASSPTDNGSITAPSGSPASTTPSATSPSSVSSGSTPGSVASTSPAATVGSTAPSSPSATLGSTNSSNPSNPSSSVPTLGSTSPSSPSLNPIPTLGGVAPSAPASAPLPSSPTLGGTAPGSPTLGSTSPGSPTLGGSAPSSPASPASPAPTSPTLGGTVTAPTCTAGSELVGARIAFIVDNSGSNGDTDCPNKSLTTSTNGTDTVYTCGSQTQREAAVLASYDLLSQIAAANSSDALASSQIAIASFPTAANVWTGSAIESNWVNINSVDRAAVASALQFARAPRGVTPYGSGLTAAAQLFGQSLPNDGRKNVVILLTDGEATDQNPAAVESQAASLRAQGITVFVMIYGGTLASSAASDSAEMQNLQSANVAAGNGNWYTSNYSSLSAYLTALIGNNGQGGLASKVASSTSNLVELQTASALAPAIESILSSKALSCAAR